MKNKQIAISILGILILLFWYSTFKLSCFSLIIPFIVTGIIFKSNYEISITKKRCFADCYLKKESFLYKFFTKHFFVILVSIMNAFMLSSILMVNLTIFNITDFFILFIDIFIIITLYNYVIKNNSINKNMNNPLTKNFVSILNSSFLVVLFLIINLFQTPPAYIDNSLVTTVYNVVKPYSNCNFINNIVTFSNEIVAIKWWIMIKMSFEIGDKYHYLKEIIWLIYLIGNYLMAYAFSKYILELINFTKEYDEE